MSDIVIRVEDISKRYRIGLREQMHDTLGAALADFVCRPIQNFQRLRSLSVFSENGQDSDDTIWALRDVSFEVRRGEILGIIGRNGAGKSTLLKILTRITEPTSGRAWMRGQVGSLLEVGTGFHAELTGRENVYLNGTVLGMNRREIDRKFDEIVDFSGVERFIDTPIKRYSSGMKVRLAFSVAAHFEPEILLIDEVLAVGDAAFQKRCLGKMNEVAKAGRTILFVSHRMGAISNLCTSALWIDDGRIAEQGSVESTISSYLKASSSKSSKSGPIERSGTGEARISNVCLLDSNGDPCDMFRMGQTIIAEFDVEFHRRFASIELSLQIKRASHGGLNVGHLLNQDSGFPLEDILPGKRSFRVEIPGCLLYPDLYCLSVCVRHGGTKLDELEDVFDFSMIQSNVSKRTKPFFSSLGVTHLPSRWMEK